MKQLSILLFFLMGALVIAFVGCSKDNMTLVQPGTMSDVQAVKMQASSSDTTIQQFSTSDEASIDDGGAEDPEFQSMAGMISATITYLESSVADSLYPVRWGRHLDWRNITRDFNVVMQSDTVAIVTITKTIPGDFRVAIGFKTADTVVVDTILHKPFTETVRRIVRFVRIARTDNPFQNWMPVSITMVGGKTNGSNPFTISSMEVSEHQIPFDQTYTDPLSTWFTFGRFLHTTIPIFSRGDTMTVHVTITSTDSMAEIVHLRHGIAGGHPDRGRMLMHLISTSGVPGNYVRVYERTFRTGLPSWAFLAVRFNAVADVISRESIYNNSAPFSNEFWGLPYIVVQ